MSLQVGCNVERDLLLQVQAVSYTILGSLWCDMLGDSWDMLWDSSSTVQRIARGE